MGKVALLLIGVLGVVGMTVTLGSQQSLMDSEKRLAEDQFEVLARNAALAGLDLAEQKLADSFQEYTLTGDYDGVEYETSVQLTGGTSAVVQSVGTAVMAGEKEVPFTIRAEYEKVNVPVIADEAPPFMRYAVMSEDDLHLSGDVDAEVYGDDEVTLNANMHTNGRMSINGNAARVRGYGTYVTSESVNNPDVVFQPNYMPEGKDDVLYSINSITIPDVDPPGLQSFYTGAGGNVVTPPLTDGVLTLSGEVDYGGTREDPAVVYVDGDVVAESSTITGYTMFIATGEIDFRGNVQAGPTNYDGAKESSLAFYSGMGMRLRGNAEVWGQVLAQGGIEFYSGTPTVYGSVTTKGMIDFKGNVSINYVTASPALTTAWNDPVTRLKRIAYSEW